MLLRFYVRHGKLTEAIRHTLARSISPSLFIAEVVQVCMENNLLHLLQAELLKIGTQISSVFWTSDYSFLPLLLILSLARARSH